MYARAFVPASGLTFGLALSLSLPLSLSLIATLTPHLAAAGPYTDPGHAPAAMAAWASVAVELVRGPIDLATPDTGLASFGAAQNALGVATASTADVVSLGDGGSITVAFELPVHNGPGDDLAVYENGFPYFGGLFAELAFVEVSSDGVDFAAFPATALPSFPVATGETLDPTDYHGLAGRHVIGLGTGFDLAALARDPAVLDERIDLQRVHYVRITDVVGDGSRLDAAARPVFDPYPTPFATSGFDLEAVGARFVPEPGHAPALLAGLVLLTGAPRGRRAKRLERIPFVPRAASRTAFRTTTAALAGAALLAVGLPSTAFALTATFDDLGLGPNAVLNGATLAGGFESGGVFFENQYDATYDVFSGFAASTTADATTPGFGNQFSNATGSGAGGSAGFGIGFFSARIVLPASQTVQGAWFTNTTYAALSMRDGDFFSKRFGGPTGADPDFFRLRIEGFDDSGISTGSASLLLADYRFADPAQDYILDEWVFLDLTVLGAVRELRFGFESSDVGSFGINTPTYFAIDDLSTIPEPGTAWLIGLGLAALARRPSGNR